MKTLKRILTSAFIVCAAGMIMSFTSNFRDASALTFKSNPFSKGGLMFSVKNAADVPTANAVIRLYKTRGEIAIDKPFVIKETDVFGNAHFGFLEPRSYFYKMSYVVGRKFVTRTGFVRVRAQDRVLVKITYY